MIDRFFLFAQVTLGSWLRVCLSRRVASASLCNCLYGDAGSGGNVTSGKLRYVESGGRGARGGRGGAVAASQDAKGEGVNGDGKNQDGKQARDNGETVLQSQEVLQVAGSEDRKRQDGSLWSESGTLLPCMQLVEGTLKVIGVVQWVVV